MRAALQAEGSNDVNPATVAEIRVKAGEDGAAALEQMKSAPGSEALTSCRFTLVGVGWALNSNNEHYWVIALGNAPS